jgi:hypothetical protein
MRYNNQMKGMPTDPGMLPSAATTTNMSLTGTTIPAAPIVSEPRTFNPGVKPSGAPVNFNPKTQSTMTGVFGMPTD